MASTLFKQLHQESLSADEVFEWYASSMLALRVVLAVSKLQSESQQVIIKKIAKDAAYRAKCIDVLKVLDMVEWRATRRAELATKVRDNICAALAAGNVQVTNQLLSQPIDFASIAVKDDISAEDVNALCPQQSGREEIYALVDRLRATDAQLSRLGSDLRRISDSRA